MTKFRQYIVKELATVAGSIRIAVAGLVTGLLSKLAILDQFVELSEAERISIGVAVGSFVAWAISTIAGYYNVQGVKEIQETLNQATEKEPSSPLKVDGAAGLESVTRAHEVVRRKT